MLDEKTILDKSVQIGEILTQDGTVLDSFKILLTAAYAFLQTAGEAVKDDMIDRFAVSLLAQKLEMQKVKEEKSESDENSGE